MRRGSSSELMTSCSTATPPSTPITVRGPDAGAPADLGTRVLVGCQSPSPPCLELVSTSHSHHSSTPSPVRALRKRRRAAGFTSRTLPRNRSRSKSRCGSRSILLTTTTSHGPEHHRVLERLLLALGDRVDHRPRVLTDVELGRAHEVADVLDDEQVEVVERQPAEAGPDHHGVEVALAAEAGGWCSRAPPARRGRRARRRRGSSRCRPRGRRRAARSPSIVIVRLSSVVLPAPGDDIRLTVTTPAAAKSARFASAIRSFSARMVSSTATRSLPVSA